MKFLALLITSIGISLSTYAQAPIAHYDFSGGAATDITGNGHDGILEGTLPAVSGKCGGSNTALQFSVNNFVRVPSDPAFDMREWSISATVMLTAFESGTCQVSKIVQRGGQYTNDYICMEVNDNFVDANCYVFTPTAQQPIGCAAGWPTSYTTPATGNLNLNQWYCITCVYGQDEMRTYIDGVLNHVEYWPDQYAGGYPSFADLLIGSGTGSGGMTYYFRGSMDDLSIYDRALTDDEVAGLCNGCPCSVDDVQYCSALSTPFDYTFTPTLTPATNCAVWNFGDGTGNHYSGAGSTITHTFPPTGGTYKICVQSYNCDEDKPCGEPKCFDMCMEKSSGAKMVSTGKNTKGNALQQTTGTEKSIGTPYPNPANSVLNVPVNGLKGAITLSVLSIDGVKLLDKTVVLSEGSNLIQLNTAVLKVGTYTLEVLHNNKKTVLRFSKL